MKILVVFYVAAVIPLRIATTGAVERSRDMSDAGIAAPHVTDPRER